MKLARNLALGLSAALLALMIAGASIAQTPVTTGNEFQTGQAGKLTPGVVNMCVDPVDSVSKPCGGAGNPINVTGAGGSYGSSQTAITGNAAGTTGAVVGTLAAAASKTTYICGFNVSAIGGTAAVGPITVAGLVGSSQVYQMSSSAGGALLSQAFSPCIPASAANTAITITTTANGTATAVDVNSWGFRQ